MDAAEILVIILATAFALFLVLTIILVVLLIKIVQQIKRITTSAERTIGRAEDAMAIFQKAVGPAIATKIMGKIAGSLLRKMTGSKKR